jgi:ribonuclease G
VKKIIINNEIWQTRAAILSDNRLQDIYFDTSSKEDLERCYFKGKVCKVLPGIQTAFVDIGQAKAGFLHISEVDRALATEKVLDAMQLEEEEREDVAEFQIKEAITIDKIFTEGEDILVQVIKEPIHEKGAKLTTCFTVPGRFLVLMPNIPQIGVSKKIENREERSRLREIMQKSLPDGMGVIVRTTADGRSEKDLVKDLAFLITTWKSIQKKFGKSKAGDKLYQDLPVVLRAVREHLDDDVEMVITDNKENQNEIHKYVNYISPENLNKIRFYQGPPSLFERFEIDKQIEKALDKKVQLKSGGSLIIESTEAMTVIDVNTGKFTGSGKQTGFNKQEDTILKTNLEAADEIVTQLRLRNIGGLIVIDFIDMASQGNRQKLSRFLERMLKEKDKYQSVTLKISEFGLVQMTRKRSGKTLQAQLTNTCQCCNGRGFAKSVATISFKILRNLKEDIIRQGIKDQVVFAVSNKVFDHLAQNEYNAILALEKSINCKITLESHEDYDDDQFTIRK